jgi:hypothetical protein
MSSVLSKIVRHVNALRTTCAVARTATPFLHGFLRRGHDLAALRS